MFIEQTFFVLSRSKFHERQLCRHGYSTVVQLFFTDMHYGKSSESFLRRVIFHLEDENDDVDDNDNELLLSVYGIQLPLDVRKGTHAVRN